MEPSATLQQMPFVPCPIGSLESNHHLIDAIADYT